ncbi:helix-turn-helix transcriptional regulator [Streptomyces sp. ME19-01-6]|uniref:helix-turn-helix transcriptional regulator n=1 Tax=Streptomyces sp. ME19-01-6 TaxID=3028686 RepID=UPI0029B9BA85|nr:AAA family ATPase [Streptomyces sp. ME19-01-6]MDX3232174.1 AAA family ATPase [Streptomyces sp. ME19-01-6]
MDRTDDAWLPGALIGRARELAALGDHAEAARSGRAGLVILSGPAGIGKTTLLHAFVNGGACQGMTVLHGRCGEVVTNAGYGGVRALFGGLRLTEAGDEGVHASPLLKGSARRALPALRPSPGEEEPGTAATVYPVLHGLYWLAVNLTARGPLVLVLDDAHWCDERSLRWIDFLLRRADDLPLLVVLAQRTETEPAAPGALADIAVQPRSTAIRLEPLTEEGVGEMVGRVFPTPDHLPDTAFVERVAAVSGGNPLMLAKLLSEVRSMGASPDEKGLGAVAEVGQGVVALSVRALMGRLSPWVRDVATAIAVLGEEAAEHVGALAGVPAALVEEAVAALRRAEVVAPDRVDLVHDVVRSAVLDSCAAEELGELRSRAALLLSDAGRPAEEVAGQLLLVPVVDQPWMRRVLREAAAGAETRGAPEAAIRCLYRVLEAEPHSVSARAQLARSLAEINPPEAVALLEEALALAVDVRVRATLAVQLGLVCLTVQRAPAAVRVLGEVLDALEAELGSDPRPDPADRELRALVQSVLLITGCDEKATIAAVRGRFARMAAPAGDTPAQRQTLAMMSVLTAMDGRSAERAVRQARRAQRVSDAATGTLPLIFSAFTLGLADEARGALEALDRSLRYSQENAAVWTYVLALSTRSVMRHSMGEIPDALADAQTAVEIIAEERWSGNVTMPQTALATALVDRGEPERAEELLERIARPNLDGFVMEYHWYLMARARARWALGDREAALGLLLDCGRSLEEAGITNPAFAPWWAEAACLLAELKRPEEAGDLVEWGAEPARRWGTPRALGLAALARGVTTKGRPGVELLAESVELLSRSPARAEHARAEYLLGGALLEAGDPRGAREHLRTAADLAWRCGALALAKEARRRLVASGGRMREITTSPVDLLTGMERTVAGLAAAGAGNREIAESLFITVRTVEMHLSSVYRKLIVGHRTELGAALRSPTVAGPQAPAWVSASRGRR